MYPFAESRRRLNGHTLVELTVAMVASSFLLAGLGSVMLIARQVALTPVSAHLRIEANEVVNQIADELRYANLILEQSSRALEFVVADRDGNYTTDRIRYAWSGTVGDPLYKRHNGSTSVAAENVQDFNLGFMSSQTAASPVSRVVYTYEFVRLQLGIGAHSRVEASVPLLARPERVSAYWRTDFDPAENPPSIDADGSGYTDWVASNGATFTPAVLTGGVWTANGDLATNVANDFTENTILEARCKNMSTSGSVDVLRINADRQGGSYAPLIVRMQRQADGSQTLTLVGMPTSGSEQILTTVDNLSDDYVKFRLTIATGTNQVGLQINDVGDSVLGGPFVYPTHAATGTDRFVKIGGGAHFDYVEVRTLPPS